MINPIVRVAFYVFAFSIPIEYPTPLPTQIHTVTAAVFLLAALLQPGVCFRRPRAAVWWFLVYLWVYLALALVSVHAIESLSLFGHFLFGALLLWAGSNLMRDSGVARAAVVSFVIGCTALAAFELAGIGESVIDPGASARRTIFRQDANFLGGNMALALTAGLAFVTASPDARIVPLMAAASVPLAISLLASGSRGAFLALGVGLLAFVVAGPTPGRVLKRVAVAFVVAAALVWTGSTFEATRNRVERTLETANMAGREHIYPEAWHMIVEKPVLGWGPVDARYELRLRTAIWEVDKVRPTQPERDAHNLVLESLMASGLAGTVPFLICIALCVRAAWQGRGGPHGAASFALVGTVLALSMGANWSMSKEAWLVFGYGLASSREGSS